MSEAAPRETFLHPIASPRWERGTAAPLAVAVFLATSLRLFSSLSVGINSQKGATCLMS